MHSFADVRLGCLDVFKHCLPLNTQHSLCTGEALVCRLHFSPAVLLRCGLVMLMMNPAEPYVETTVVRNRAGPAATAPDPAARIVLVLVLAVLLPGPPQPPLHPPSHVTQSAACGHAFQQPP